MSKGYPAPPITGTKVLTTTTGVVDWVNAGSGTDTLDGLAKTDGNFAVANGTAWVAENGATARTSLGVAIGSDVQAYGAILDDLNTLGAAASDGEFIVATGAGAFAYESGATARTSLGLAIGTDVQAHGAGLDDLNTLGAVGANGEFLVGTGAGTLAWESGATARTSIGLGTGDAAEFLTLEAGSPTYTPSGTVRVLLGLGTKMVDAKWTSYNDSQAGFTVFRYDTGYVTLQSTFGLNLNTGNAAFLFTNNVGGAANNDFAAIDSAGAADVRVRFGRASTTTGEKFYEFFDQGTTINHKIGGEGGVSDSYFCSQGGPMGIGLSSPSSSYMLDVHDTTTSGFVMNIENDSTASTCDGLRIKLDVVSSGTGNGFISCVDGGGEVGGCYADGASGVTWNTTSDRTLKRNIRPATGNLDEVRKWGVMSYEWRSNGRAEVGFIAQDMHEHLPGAVHDPSARNAMNCHVTYSKRYTVDVSEGDAEEAIWEERFTPMVECVPASEVEALRNRRNVRDLVSRPIARGDKGWGNWSMDYSRTAPRLAGATQELAALVEALTGKVEQLEARIAALEA